MVPIPMKEHAMYSGASYYISPGDEQSYTIRLTDYYDRLPYGEYRYVKTVGCLDVDVDFSYQAPEKNKRRRK